MPEATMPYVNPHFIGLSKWGFSPKSQSSPINVGSSVYGLAAGMAFLKVIFYLEMHHRIGPILFCIRQVFWDIAT